MKFFITLLFCFISSLAHSDDFSKESFINAWQSKQLAGKHIESLTEKDIDLFEVKFSKLPYEGELKILSVELEEFNDIDGEIGGYGFAEIDLVDAPNDFITKYENTFYKWKESNTLYFNKVSGTWITAEDYRSHLKDQPQQNINWLWSILNYWDLILAFILFYFVISQFTNNRKINKSLEIQQQALEHQIESINKASALHKQTNDLLKELIRENKS